MTRDVVVVGGGIIGMSVGLRLARAGMSVSVFERHQAGSEASVAAAGLLAAQCLTDPPDPGSVGVEEAFLGASLRARAMYPDFVEGIAALSRRPVGWSRQGNLCVASAAREAAVLEERVRRHRARGLSARLLDGEETAILEPGIRAFRGALFPDDGVVDNQALMPSLREALPASGAILNEQAPVLEILVDSGRVTGVRTERETHGAAAVVLATGAWSERLMPREEPRISMRPSRGQIVVLDAGGEGPQIPVIGDEMYIVPRAGGRVLLGSTVEDAGFDRGTTAGGIAAIVAGVAAFCPRVLNWSWVTAWSGLRPRPSDDWPVVGPAAATRGLWMAGGHYRNGILWAPLTAEWILRGIRGEPLPEEAAWFAPGRFASFPGRG